MWYKKFNGVLLFVCFLCVGSFTSEAQLMIEESRVELEMASGETITKEIKVYNTSSEMKKVKVYWEDFEYVEPFSGHKEFYREGYFDTSIAHWVNLTPSYLTIPAKGKAVVTYSIDMPSDVFEGGYGVLFFEEVSNDVSYDSGVQVVMRSGTLIFVHYVNADNSANISNIRTDDEGLTGLIKNSGNRIIFPEGRYHLISEEGIVVDRGEISKMYLPMGKEASFKWGIDEDLPNGNYDLILTFDLGQGYSVVKEIEIDKRGLKDFFIKNIGD